MKVLAVALHLKLGFGMILLEQSQQPMLGVSVSLVGTPLKCHHPLWNGLQKKRENHPEIRLDIMVWCTQTSGSPNVHQSYLSDLFNGSLYFRYLS